MPQMTSLSTSQSAQGAAANGTTAELAGYNGAQVVEIAETNGGTSTMNVNIEGSFDGVNWYAVGYQQVDATAAPARAVAAIAVTASMRHVYQVLDPYPLLRVRTSSPANGALVTARVYAVPV